MSRATIRIPTIDLAAFGDFDGEGIASQVDQACRHSGFFLLRGHGIQQELLDRVHAASRAFFDQPHEVKAACRSSFLGYRGVNTLRASTRNADAPPDAKETFTIGREPSAGEDASEFIAPNIWPETPDDFRSSLLAYYESVGSLVVRIGRLFASALELPPDFFVARSDRQISWLTLINYPAGLDHVTGSRRFGEHRDRGCFTILSTTGPGLEVQDEFRRLASRSERARRARRERRQHARDMDGRALGVTDAPRRGSRRASAVGRLLLQSGRGRPVDADRGEQSGATVGDHLRSMLGLYK